MNSTVTCQDTRLRKGVGTSGAVKRLICCVNVLVNLKNLRYRESLVTLGKKRRLFCKSLSYQARETQNVCGSGISVAIIFVLESTGSLLYLISVMECY